MDQKVLNVISQLFVPTLRASIVEILKKTKHIRPHTFILAALLWFSGTLCVCFLAVEVTILGCTDYF